MPNYKNGKFFSQLPDNAAFDAEYTPGDPTPVSGIYRCVSCGFEAVSTETHPLPPTKICPNHAANWKCQHGPVRWQLVAAAIHSSA
jgi:hypothetical protein